MNRRSVIKNMLFATAAVSLAQACVNDKSKAGMLMKNVPFTADEESMLASLCETIIPATPGVPGAKDLSSHLFVMTMVDDCITKDNSKEWVDQKRFAEGMQAFEGLVKKRYNTGYAKLTEDQKKALLADLEKNKDVPKEAVLFYNVVKGLTIESFTTSQYYLTKVEVYELIPNRYHGCVPVKTA